MLRKLYLGLFFVLVAFSGYAQESDENKQQQLAEVSKKFSNPLSDLWYLVTENHYMSFENSKTGEKVTGDFFYFQPVLPTKIGKNDEFLLIHRPTLGFLTLDEKATGVTSPLSEHRYNTKLTDFRWVSFFVPNKSTGLVYGAGPMVAAPLHTDLAYTSENWQAGFGAALIYLSKVGFVGGFIYTQTFDLVDSTTDDTAQLQYMLSYDFNPRFQVYMSPIIDINYDARGGEKLDLPVGIGVKTTFFVGKIPMRLGLSYERYVVSQNKALSRDNTIKILWTPVIPNLSEAF